jgi:hypothetical protein
MARQHGVFETISDTGLPDIRGTELPTAIVARFPRLVDCADTLRMNLIVALHGLIKSELTSETGQVIPNSLGR